MKKEITIKRPLLEISLSTFRRKIRRYESDGINGLFVDNRRTKVSNTQTPVYKKTESQYQLALSFQKMIDAAGITQKEAAKLIAAHTNRPCSVRAVRSWLA